MTEAIVGCGSTVYHKTVPEELVGASSWEFTEDAKSSEYSDNSTGCGTKDTVGPVTQKVKVSYNVQDGTDKGKIPWRARDVVPVQLHIDDTTANYWEGSVLVISVGGYKFESGSSDPVACEFDCKVQGELTGVGTLAEA
jgi:hypothetical protein